MHYQDPYHKIVTRSGFVEKTAEIGEASLNYAEGPDNGPPLLLLHAQHMDWFSFSRVLPELSRCFHIYAVDYHGHGKTSAPPESMCGRQIGRDLTVFIRTVIRRPVFLSGNSSGGILTAWIAAMEPEWVRAIILEDPALLSSECPRLHDTIADKSFAVCQRFLQEGREDFLTFWIESCRDFFKKHVGFDAGPLLIASINSFRKRNPGKPVEICYLPVMLRLMMRGMSMYDPHFGAAFHDGSWNADFDHAQTLAQIQCPALLLHANFEIQENGILYGALDQTEADHIIALIPNAKYMRVDSGHVIHLLKPKLYTQIVKDFFLTDMNS